MINPDNPGPPPAYSTLCQNMRHRSCTGKSRWPGSAPGTSNPCRCPCHLDVEELVYALSSLYVDGEFTLSIGVRDDELWAAFGTAEATGEDVQHALADLLCQLLEEQE